MRPVIATVDGTGFTGRFAGFAAPLEVDAPEGGGPVRLRPWTYAAHMAALRHCIHAGPEGLVLEREGFASRVMAHSGLDPASHGWLAPLALWWAAGGEEDAQPPLAPDATADLGAGRARLRPWTEGERLAAFGAALTRGGAEGDRIDPVGYLDAMVRRSLVALDPEGAVDELDSRATARLLDSIVVLNVPDLAADPLLSGVLPDAVVRQTLHLCRLVGWTPTRLLAAPAAEVQRLMAMLALEAPAAPPPPRGRGLADQPDAVVFSFVEDRA